MAEEEEEIPPLVLSKQLKARVPAVTSLTSALTCTICYDPFINPVITACSHSYCSLCIRKYLVYKQQCPQCGTLATDGQLRHNKSADESASVLRSLVASLEQLVSGQPQSSKPSEHKLEKELPEAKPARTQRRPSARPAIVLDTEDSEENDENEPTTTVPPSPVMINSKKPVSIKKTSVPSNENKDVTCKPVASGSGVAELGSPLREVNSNNQTSSQGKTTCMVCGVPVQTRNYQLHLNNCLDTKQPPQPVTVKRKPLPKLVYNLLKDSELKKKCKAVGLNMKGDRKTLITRHQKYTILYNSESDLEKPRSGLELVMQVEREEKAEKRVGGTANSLLQYDRNTDAKSIESKQRQYMEQNKSSFNQLINQAKQRELQEETQPSQSTQVDPVPSTSAQQPPRRESASAHSDSKIRESYITEKIHNVDEEMRLKRHLSTDSEASAAGGGGMEQSKKYKTESVSEIELSDGPPYSDTDKDFRRLSQENVKENPQISLSSTSFSQREKPALSTHKSRKVASKSTARSKSSKSLNIADSLAMSAERNKQQDKQECPVCQALVTQRYLNIHLDKCLRKNEPDPSPIITKKTKPRPPSNNSKRSKKTKILSSSEDDYSTETDVDEEELTMTLTPPRGSRAQRPRQILKNPVIEDSEDEFQSQNCMNSSHLVAEPSLADLLNMGLGRQGSHKTELSLQKDRKIPPTSTKFVKASALIEEWSTQSSREGGGASVHDYSTEETGNRSTDNILDESTEKDEWEIGQYSTEDDKMDDKLGDDEEWDDEWISEDLDKYTDHISQASYKQDSNDMFGSSFDNLPSAQPQPENADTVKVKIDNDKSAKELGEMPQLGEQEKNPFELDSDLEDIEDDDEIDISLAQHIDAMTDKYLPDEQEQENLSNTKPKNAPNSEPENVREPIVAKPQPKAKKKVIKIKARIGKTATSTPAKEVEKSKKTSSRTAARDGITSIQEEEDTFPRKRQLRQKR